MKNNQEIYEYLGRDARDPVIAAALEGWRAQRELLAIQLMSGLVRGPVNWQAQHPDVRASWRKAAEHIMAGGEDVAQPPPR